MKDILQKVDRNDGFKVPDGYFDAFASRMEGKLLRLDMENPQSGKVLHRSVWQKIRPYVYMAAMFMGVWCMMKTFDLMRSGSSSLPETASPVLAAAIGNDQFMGEYFTTEGMLDDYQFIESLYDEGLSPALFETSAE